MQVVYAPRRGGRRIVDGIMFDLEEVIREGEEKQGTTGFG
jgi:hypothetical protein